MAASAWTLYRTAKVKLVSGLIDLDLPVFRARIFKAQAAASVSGVSLALSLLSQLCTSNQAKSMTDGPFTGASVKLLSANAVTVRWSVPNLVLTAGATCNSLQYAVCYFSASAGGGPVLGWAKLSASPFNVTTGNTLTINAPANGLLVVY